MRHKEKDVTKEEIDRLRKFYQDRHPASRSDKIAMLLDSLLSLGMPVEKLQPAIDWLFGEGT